jgi:hypothetical protein
LLSHNKSKKTRNRTNDGRIEIQGFLSGASRRCHS